MFCWNQNVDIYNIFTKMYTTVIIKLVRISYVIKCYYKKDGTHEF
jgi:hypothetical protein